MTYLKAYLGTAVSILVLDGLWIALFVRGYYQTQIGGLMRESPSIAAAGLFYLAYTAGVTALAVRLRWHPVSCPTPC